MSRSLYPVFLDLAGLPVVIVGGGPVAAGKLEGLLAAGARVTVVAPETAIDPTALPFGSAAARGQAPAVADPTALPFGSAAVRGQAPAVDPTALPFGSAADPHVRVIRARFRPAHLDGARYVVSAAPPDVNREVAKAAAERGLFVNAVDDTEVATAYLGGVVRKADVIVAISTRGLAPALAGLLREAIEAVLPEDLDRWIEVAKQARVDWKAAKVPMAERRPLLLRALERIYS